MTSPQLSSALEVGGMLGSVRRMRGESLEEAARATRISPVYLRALEADAPMSAYPAPVYAQFFLREYVRHLELAPEEEAELVEAFALLHAADTSQRQPALPEPEVHLRKASKPPLRTRLKLPSTVRRSPDPRRVRRRTVAEGLVRPPVLGPRRRGRDAVSGPGAHRRLASVLAAGALAFAVGLPLLAVAARQQGPAVEVAAVQKPEPSPTPPPTLPDGTRSIFPEHRVIAYYGAPQAESLGILGIGTPQEAGRKLMKQIEPYRKLQDKPILPAFALLATIATAAPGDDGMYRFRQTPEVIDRYLAAAREVGAILILDIQPGRANFLEEAKVLERWLKEPDVSLALDPEWHVGPTEEPGEVIGSVTAHEVNDVAIYLAGIVQRYDLPQKLLLIHQFTEGMVKDKNHVGNPSDVAVTFNVDGVGYAAAKMSKYELFTQEDTRFFHGFKLFYEEDIDLIPPEDVSLLIPYPDLVMYE